MKNKRWNEGNVLQVRSEDAVKEMIFSMSDKNTLQSDIDDLIHEIEKRTNAEQNLSPEKKSFYRACLTQLKLMKQEINSSQDVDDFLKFRKELRAMSDNEFLRSDQSLLALFKKVIEFIGQVIDKLIEKVSSSLNFSQSARL